MNSTEQLIGLLKESAQRIQALDDALQKLARAVEIVEPLSNRGLLGDIQGATLYDKALSLTKMSSRDFDFYDNLARKGLSAYQGFGSVGKAPATSGGDPAALVDRAVFSHRL
jgi:hypothetical protein